MNIRRIASISVVTAMLSTGGAGAYSIGDIVNTVSNGLQQGSSIIDKLGNIIDPKLIEGFRQITQYAQQVQGVLGYLQQFANATSIQAFTGTACQAASEFLGQGQISNTLCKISELAGPVTKMLDQNTWNAFGQGDLTDFANAAGGIAGVLGSGQDNAESLMSAIGSDMDKAQQLIEGTADTAATAAMMAGNPKDSGLLATVAPDAAASLFSTSYKANKSIGQTLAIQAQNDNNLQNISAAVESTSSMMDDVTKKAYQRRAEAANASSVRSAMEVSTNATVDMMEVLAALSQNNLQAQADQAKINANTTNVMALQARQMAEERNAKAIAARAAFSAGMAQAEGEYQALMATKNRALEGFEKSFTKAE